MYSNIEKFANTIVDYSVDVKKGELIILDTNEPESPLCKAVMKEIIKKDAYFHVFTRNNTANRRMIENASAEQLEVWRDSELLIIDKSAGYIVLQGGPSNKEMSGISEGKMTQYFNFYLTEINKKRLSKKWLVVRLPSYAEAQAANMNIDAYEEFYYKACTVDYKKMETSIEPLRQLMSQTKNVHIIAKDTDIRFSIENIPVNLAVGNVNLPDGEVYTAPVKDSLNGYIKFNTTAMYQGMSFTDVHLTFVNGKVETATCNDTKKLNMILDMDEGARYVGEFAFGTNPHINKPVGNVLFDEKINGSFHFALGNCYDVADNGVKSAIHWDIIQILRKEWGGGEIYFDDVLVQKDGLFVLPELLGINPENLI